MSGLELIHEERHRQVYVEGWNADGDDEYTHGELFRAAQCYRDETASKDHVPNEWPWDSSYWKPSTRVRNLTKAGALYLAEADRRHRANEPDARVDAAYNSAELCGEEIDALLETDHA